MAHVNLSSFPERTCKAWSPAASAYLLLLHAHDGPSTAATRDSGTTTGGSAVGKWAVWCFVPGDPCWCSARCGVLGVRLLHGLYQLRLAPGLKQSNHTISKHGRGLLIWMEEISTENLKGFKNLICPRICFASQWRRYLLRFRQDNASRLKGKR